MREILSELMQWKRSGDPIALAIVIQTWGSSPRRAGAKMAFTSEERIIGSVSGGCVEAAVVEAGLEALRTNRPQRLHFGVADETAWDVGLACGGSIDIFVKTINGKFLEAVHAAIKSEDAAVIVTVVRGPDRLLGRELLYQEDGHLTGTVDHEWDEKVRELARHVLSHGVSRRVFLSEEVELFLDVLLPAPTLVLVGGVHIAVALVSLAKTLGYQTVLIDPRSAWGNTERFPHVDKLIQAWPNEAFEQIKVTRSTAIAMLTHDPKLDDPALKLALNSPAFYIGALGSRSTHLKRCERLLEEGMSESQLRRLHAPIGLDIGSQTPEEIALSIMAEVVDAHRKRDQPSALNEADVHPIKN